MKLTYGKITYAYRAHVIGKITYAWYLRSYHTWNIILYSAEPVVNPNNNTVPEETVGDHMEGQGQKWRHQKENWFKETERYN